MKLKAKQMGSIKALKESLKKGGGSGSVTYIKNVPADGITVRFLTEPEQWFGYYEYWDDAAKNFVPMAEGEVIPDGARPSFRYLASALDIDSDRVVPLKLAKTAANSLILKYDKYDTMMDRNYELQKHGEGLDTTYDVTPDAPSKINLAKYETLDLESILVEARRMALGESDIDAKDEPFPADDVDDDDEAVVEADEDEDEAVIGGADTVDYRANLFPDDMIRNDYIKEELLAMTEEEVGEVADDWDSYGIIIDRGNIVNGILKAQEEYASEGDDDSDDDADDDADDADDEVEYDEDELRAMSLRSLRMIGAELDIDGAKTMDKDDLVDAIIDAAEA